MSDWETILKFLEEKRIKKVDFAQKMEVSRQTLDNWIKGKTYPNTAELARMSKIIADLLKAGHSYSPEQKNEILLEELKETYRTSSELKDKLIKTYEEKISKLEEELAEYKRKGGSDAKP